LTHTHAFGDVFHHGDGFLFGQTRVEQKGASAFGKLRTALAAIEQADVFVFAVPGSYGDIFCTANAVFRTVFIPTEVVRQVVHNITRLSQIPKNTIRKMHKGTIQKLGNTVNTNKTQGVYSVSVRQRSVSGRGTDGV
jgi:hypothetical protein